LVVMSTTKAAIKKAVALDAGVELEPSTLMVALAMSAAAGCRQVMSNAGVGPAGFMPWGRFQAEACHA
jgi:hypothetical protein